VADVLWYGEGPWGGYTLPKSMSEGVCLGASRTSPVASLDVEAGELPLKLWCQKLCIQYIWKLLSNPCNPPFKSVFGTGFWRLFETRPHTLPTFGIRLNQTIVDSEINLNSITINSTPYIPPCWNHRDFSYPCTYLETNRRFLLLFTNQNSTNVSLSMMVMLAFSLMDVRVESLVNLLSGRSRNTTGCLTLDMIHLSSNSSQIYSFLTLFRACKVFKIETSHTLLLPRFYVVCMV